MKFRLFRFVLYLIFVWTLPVQAAGGSPSARLTLEDFGYSDGQLRGMFGAAQLWIPFQSNWVINRELNVNLIYVASPLLHQKRSTLTILANDQPVISLHPVATGTEQEVSFTIPPHLLQGQGFTLRLQGYLRLTDLPCEETNNPGQWLTVRNKSSLAMRPDLKSDSPDLAGLPRTVVVENAPVAPPAVVFVLPDEPDETVLTTAAKVAARLGRDSRHNQFLFQVESASTLAESQKQAANLVVVGLPHDQPLLQELAQALPARLLRNGFVTADSYIAPAGHGVIQIFNSPWNKTRNVLLISAGQDLGLSLAGQAFADQLTVQALRGDFQFVRALETVSQPLPELAWLTPQTTFTQLGDRDRLVRGPGLFQELYYFRRPPGWVLESGSQLSLHLGFSPALRPTQSYVAVYINDVFVGTARIGYGIQESQFTFDLPVDLLNETPQGQRSLALNLRLEVANFLEESDCAPANPEAAWTQIYADSFFVTPHVYLPLPDLQAFPYPFVGDPVETPVAIILPPQPNSVELGTGISLAATLGHYAPVDFELIVQTADQVSAETRSEANLIVIGSKSRQPLVAQALAEMSDVPGYRGLDGLYQALKNSKQGLLRTGPSPWNAERVILLAFGETDAGFVNATQALLEAVPPVDQPGSVAIIEAGQPPRIIYRPVNAPPVPKPGQVLREPLIAPPPPWVVITGVLAITTAAVVITIWASRRWASVQRSD